MEGTTLERLVHSRYCVPRGVYLGERASVPEISRLSSIPSEYIRKHIKVEAMHRHLCGENRTRRNPRVYILGARGNRDKQERRTIRHLPPSDVSVTFERRLARLRHAYLATLVHRSLSTPVHTTSFLAPPTRKQPPPQVGGSCVGCTRERNWVRQTRGRPSQAEARESSRRFRLEAVPWKPPRSPSSLHQSIVDPSSSPSLPFSTTASSPCERERDRAKLHVLRTTPRRR